LNVQLSPELPPCLIGDAMRLSQVLINLGSNAIKFSPQGRVDIHVDVLNSHGDDYFIRFAVKDTGIGIHPDATQKIFEGFAQAEGSTTRRFGGTGLGLAICQHLVQLMGGDLQLESKLGDGSRFWFDISLKRGTSVLPLQSTVARPGYRVEGSPQAPTARRLEGLRILLVEDNATNRQVARELLVDEGATVSEAVNGLDGVQQVQADPGGFDVVLMDLQMPVMDGLTAAATLRDHLGASTPPIIAMTANVRAADQAEARNAGMVAHVGKPFDLDELVQALLTHGRGMATASGPTPEAETSPAAKASAAIDVDRAVARFGGRKDVYLRMLQSCLGDVRQALAELPRLWAELDTQALRAQLHTLKGLSGTLGHAQLASLMAAAEDEVKGAVWQPETPPCLSKALAALADTPTLIEAVMTELGELPLAQAPADAAPDPAHLHTALRGLLDLLKRSDMSALDAFEALRTRHQAHFAPLLDPLAADMDQLNFAGAILQIQQALDASIQGEAHA
jgi:CheY-like chemotaxis protein